MRVPTAKVDLSMIAISDFYPDSVITDAIEEKIAKTLPPVAGLVPGLSAEARFAVYEASISTARQAFIAQHGGPYGCVVGTPDAKPMASHFRLAEMLEG